jgi:hypothetical protein
MLSQAFGLPNMSVQLTPQLEASNWGTKSLILYIRLKLKWTEHVREHGFPSEHIFNGLHALGFENNATGLKIYLSKYREVSYWHPLSLGLADSLMLCVIAVCTKPLFIEICSISKAWPIQGVM